MAESTFSPDDIKHIARLAALKIDPDNIPAYCTSLGNTFKMINQLLDVNTDTVTLTSYPMGAKQRLRKDEVTIGDQRDILLKGCPDTQAGLILVPKVIE